MSDDDPFRRSNVLRFRRPGDQTFREFMRPEHLAQLPPDLREWAENCPEFLRSTFWPEEEPWDPASKGEVDGPDKEPR